MHDFTDTERISRQQAAERLTDAAYAMVVRAPVTLQIDGERIADPDAEELLVHWDVSCADGRLSFSPIIQRGFDAEMAAVCLACKVRHVDIAVAEIGRGAPGRVVSDLQSHPNTKVAVFGTAETGTGLPVALRAPQVKVKRMGWGPPPAILGYIKQGRWDAAIGVDGFTMLWAQVDALARMAAGEPLTEGQKKGLPPVQILTQKDITFDPTKGWQAYPDFAQRFARLWGAES